MSQIFQGDTDTTNPGDVVGPASAVNNDLAAFNGTTGKLLKDSGILLSNVVQGPASVADNTLARFDATTGKLIQGGSVTVSDTGLFAGAIMPSAQVIGTTTNDNAAAGYVGEFTSDFLPRASAITLTTNVVANIASVTLTAGDWDVFGILGFYGNGGTVTGTNFTASTSIASVTLGNLGDNAAEEIVGPVAGASTYPPLATWRVSTASPVTAYLLAKSTFTVGTCKAFGRISARRVR